MCKTPVMPHTCWGPISLYGLSLGRVSHVGVTDICLCSVAREVGYVTGMLIYNGYRLVNPNPSRHEVSFIPGVIWSRRRNWCRAPRVRRRRSYRLLRARAGKKRRQGGKGEGGAEPDRTGQDTTRPDSDRGARRPRPELQSRLMVVMSGLA